ncbi:MAG TPA: type II toxin-antitoxin system VapC family toxin [Candidatus Sulfotelmatobacter sp.]
MSFLLDTNVVSEWVKPKPNAGLMRWTGSIDEDRVFLSVVSLAELRRGIERLQAGARQRMLGEWLRYGLPSRFEGRILPIDPAVADVCGRIVHRSEKQGRPIEAMDAFIAATAEVYQLTLVTRNVSHFVVLKDVLNPWTDS